MVRIADVECKQKLDLAAPSLIDNSSAHARCETFLANGQRKAFFLQLRG